MPKQKKNRFVQQPPAVAYFKPQGIPLFQLEQVVLDVDEFEAIRLVDYEGLHLEDAAERMRISRATCARMVDSAHRKIGTALTNGHAIRIEGGSFVLGKNRYRCRDCGSRWEIEIGAGSAPPGGAVTCPACRSERVQDLAREIGFQAGPQSHAPPTPPRPGRHGRGGLPARPPRHA